MDLHTRTNLTSTSIQTRNKKLGQILENRDVFVPLIQNLRDEFGENAERSFQESSDAAMVEGRDISVCVRVRPLMPHENESGLFASVIASNPYVNTLDPKFDVKGNPKIVESKYEADFVFGPQHNNDDVYGSIAAPLIELGLKGGVCTMLAYGQTGSGKTFTISGVLDRIAFDLFKNCDSSSIKFHVSLFELLGNQATDLLAQASGQKVEILEDKFGKVVTKGATEIELTSGQHFVDIIRRGMAHRKTETTFKNDTSSRSHAICSIRVENTLLKEAEDGRIFIVDLAGSENAADAQFHEPGRIKETQLINKSLMSLKDCIRNRALSAINPDQFYHVPYRQSRLTMLMKDAFEVESHRHCKTVVFAVVSPSVGDLSMTNNTLKYAAPLRIGQNHRQKVLPHPDNPAGWSNDTLRQWVSTQSNGKIDPEVLCPFESGMQLLRIPETEFLSRVMKSNPKIGEKKAKVFYTSLWKLLIDARTRERKEKLKPKDGMTNKQRLAKIDQEYYAEMMSRNAEEGGGQHQKVSLLGNKQSAFKDQNGS